MSKQIKIDETNFRDAHRELVGVTFYLLAALGVLLGLLLKTLSHGKTSFLWEILGELGSFLAVTLAVALIYERLIHRRDHLHVLHDIGTLLDEKLDARNRGLTIYENGRPQLAQKLDLYLQAKEEIIELGTTLRTFAGYFEQRPAAEYKDHIVKLLASGVHIKCVMNSLESPSLVDDGVEVRKKLARSLGQLDALGREFAAHSLKGSFSIHLFQNFPRFAAIVIDGATDNGQLIFTPYLFGLRNAEAPAFYISKFANPVLFSKLWASVENQIRNSRPYVAPASSEPAKADSVANPMPQPSVSWQAVP